MNILVLCDDRWHPAATPRQGLAPLQSAGWTFDWIENARHWSAEKMAEYEVTLLTKANNVSAGDETPWMTPEVEQAFAAYVQSGGGLLAIHSGTAGYKEQRVLRALLGGVFDQHPAQCTVVAEPVPGHALTAGAGPFEGTDEHYFMLVDEPNIDVFLHTRSEHGLQPAGWTRREGAGRVCVLTPGHNLPIWLTPPYQALIAHALRWCGEAR